MELKAPNEYAEACVFASWLRRHDVLFSHIPNSTYTDSIATRARNKAVGVARGVPDYIILFKDRIIFVELKRREGGRVSPEQVQWGIALERAGVDFRVCRGADEAIAFVQDLTGLP